MIGAVDPASGIQDPVEILGWGRNFQRQLCTDLERLADQVGCKVDFALCNSLLTQITCGLPVCHRDEETVFKLLVLSHQDDGRLRKCVEVAVEQHNAIETSMIELSEPLAEIGNTDTRWEPDAVGFLLRYCFSSLQQHLDWEDAVFFEDLSNLVPEGKREFLVAALQRNRSRHHQRAFITR